MNPWKALLSIVTVIGGAFFSATAFATTLTAVPARYDPTNEVATIGVDLKYVARGGYGPGGGSVVFTELNNTLGTVPGFNGSFFCDLRTQTCAVRLALAPGYPLGLHTITASYSGSDFNSGQQDNPPASLTFTIYVSDPAWLPAVLSLLD